jgi:hypothetical protein
MIDDSNAPCGGGEIRRNRKRHEDAGGVNTLLLLSFLDREVKK